MSSSWHLHPILSSLPGVGFVFAALAEAIRIFFPSKVNNEIVGAALFVGVAGVIAAYLSGTSAAESASQTFIVPDAVIAWHHTWGRMALFAAIPTAAMFLLSQHAKFYRAAILWGYRVLLFVTLVLSFYTAHLGGELVFDYGAGVSAPFTK